jgi:iron complex transport system substrate-binding protein
MKFLLLCLTLFSLSSQAEVSAIDFHQRKIILDKPAQRIVALAPHIVENTYSAGAGDKLVGVVSFSDFPEAAKAVKRIGNFQSLSLEAIVALQPDLILMWGSGNGMNTFNSLQKIGVPIFISDPKDIKDVSYTIRAIGQLAGTETVSEPEAMRIEQAVALMEKKYRNRQPVSVFYQVWDEPLQTLNGEHLISHVMEICGGYNVFADAASLAPKINLESVLHRNPNAIVAGGMGEARPEWLDRWKQYPSLNAVQNDALFFIHPDHLQRPTSRILIGTQRLCEQLDSARR